MSHAAMKPIRIRCCCCSCCGFVYCTPLERQQWGGGDTIVSTFHKTLTFPKAFLTWRTTLLLLVKPKNYQIASDLALQYVLLQSFVNVYKKLGKAQNYLKKSHLLLALLIYRGIFCQFLPIVSSKHCYCINMEAFATFVCLSENIVDNFYIFTCLPSLRFGSSFVSQTLFRSWRRRRWIISRRICSSEVSLFIRIDSVTLQIPCH